MTINPLLNDDTDEIAGGDNSRISQSSAVQTDISAIPQQWRSENHLFGTDYSLSGFTLPSKHAMPKIGHIGMKKSLRSNNI